MLKVTIFSPRRSTVVGVRSVEGGMGLVGSSCGRESSGESADPRSCLRLELPRCREGPALCEGRSPAMVYRMLPQAHTA